MKHFKANQIVLLSLLDLTLRFPIQLKIIKVRVRFIYNLTSINVKLCLIITIFVRYANKRSFCYHNTDRVTFDLNHVAFWTNKSQGEFLSYIVIVPTYFTSYSHFIFINKYV